MANVHSMIQQIGKVWRIPVNLCSVITFLTVTLLIVFKSSTTFSQITTRPLDATSLVGQRVQLNCRSQEILDWYFVPGSPLNNSEYNRRCNKFKLDRCLMITSSGQLTDTGKQRYNESRQYSLSGSPKSTLSFEAVDMSYAGAYRCEGGFLDNSKINAFVTVIEPTPNCTKDSFFNSRDDVQLRCKFSFVGRAPRLQWKIDSSNQTLTDCVEEQRGILCVTHFPAFLNDGDIFCRLGQNPGTETKSNESRVVYIFESRTQFNTILHCSVAVIEYTMASIAELRINDDFVAEQEQEDSPKIHFFYHPFFLGASSGTVGLIVIASAVLVTCFLKRRRNKQVTVYESPSFRLSSSPYSQLQLQPPNNAENPRASDNPYLEIIP